MNRDILIFCLLTLLLIGTSFTQAQPKNIVISDDLVATAEVFKVIGTNPKLKFGDYAVLKSKIGWAVTSERTNLLNTKTESKSENKYSFVLSNKTSDSAIVNAMCNVTIKEHYAFKLFSSDRYTFYLGDDDLLMNSHIVTSFITTSSNNNDMWVLRMEETYGSHVKYKNGGVFGNGERIINIIPVNSNKDGNDSRKYPALGFEFIENGQSLCALQYWGGGLTGFNNVFVWIKSDLEPRMKLILAAGIASLMQTTSACEDPDY